LVTAPAVRDWGAEGDFKVLRRRGNQKKLAKEARKKPGRTRRAFPDQKGGEVPLGRENPKPVPTH